MRYFFLLLLSLFVAPATQALFYMPAVSVSSIVHNELIVVTRTSQSLGFGLLTADPLLSRLSMISDTIGVISFADGDDVATMVQQLRSNSQVDYVQPNYVYYTQSSAPSDTFFGTQWGLHNTGQTLLDGSGNLIGTGVAGADISWLSGMAIWSGVDNPSITGTVVAVIDNGILYTHEDLSVRMWDGNGCVSHTGLALNNCIHGYDYFANDNDPIPFGSDFHGTHVAGIVGASRNGIGVVGVNPRARLMALRAGSGNTLTTLGVVNSILFAQQNGAMIVNASFGGTGNDTLLQNTIAGYSGLFIAAAGNLGFNHAITNVYPCDYGSTMAHVICVGASTQKEQYADFSDFGSGYVHVAAPGKAIASTVNANGSSAYAYVDGTSMATPFVAGIASLIWSFRPELTRLQVKDIILSTADEFSVYSGKVTTSARVNLYNAIVYAAELTATTPDPFTFVSVTGALPLTWYESEVMVVSGFVGSLDVLVNNGQYRINGGSRETTSGSIASGDTLQVRVLSSWEPNLTDFVNVSVGSYGTNFSVTTMAAESFDTVVYFADGRRHYNVTGVSVFIDAATGTDYRIFGQNLVTEYTGVLASDANEIVVELNGTTGVTYVGVVLGTGGNEVYYTNSLIYDVSIPYLLAFFTPGQTVYGTSFSFTGSLSDDFALSGLLINGVAYTSCDFDSTDLQLCDFSTTVVFADSGLQDITLVYGDKAGNTNTETWSVFVDTWDRTPDPFSFTAQNGVTRSTVVESNVITVAGVDTGVVVSVVGGQYRVGTGVYTSATGMVSSGDTIQLRMTSSANYSTTSTAVLTVGLGSGSWTVTTQSAPVSPGGPPSSPPGGPSCNPSSVTNGQVNQSTCTITCNAGYSLSGQQCLAVGTGEVLTGDVQQTGLLLTGEQMMQLFTPSNGGQSIAGAALVVPEEASCAPASELQAAYVFAYGIGITTMPNIAQARMCDGVLRSELAKMVANYAMQVHGLVPDESRACNFADIANQSFEMQYYIRLVCQLGIMGVGLTNFEPNGLVDRAQWGTVLSRILYGAQHDGANPYYVNHLNALQANGIISNTNPTLRELRGYVMLMMMRAGN